MSLLCSFKCFDIILDLHDTERVPIGTTDHKYYLTPKKLASIEAWMIRNNISKIDSEDLVHNLIQKNMIASF